MMSKALPNQLLSFSAFLGPTWQALHSKSIDFISQRACLRFLTGLLKRALQKAEWPLVMCQLTLSHQTARSFDLCPRK